MLLLMIHVNGPPINTKLGPLSIFRHINVMRNLLLKHETILFDDSDNTCYCRVINEIQGLIGI